MRIGKSIFAALLLALVVAAPASASEKKGTGRLVPSDVVVSAHIDDGFHADISFRVTNRSQHAQRSRRAQLSLVDDSSKARRLGNVSLPRLAGGAKTDQSVSRLVRNATPAGTYRAQVCVRSQVRLRCATSDLAIQIEPAAFSADPSPVNFGDVTLGEASAPVDVKITNTGGVKSGVPTPSIAGGNAADFTLVGDDCDNALAAGQSCTASLRFTPGGAGARSASLEVAGTTTASLSGTGLKAAELQVTPSSNDFGKVLIGSISDSKTFTVTNVGESPSSALNANTTDNQFGIPLPDDDCSTVVLDPGQTCTVDVNFGPNSHGDQSGSLEVSATEGGTATATLSGFGGDPAKLEITPAPYDFGKVLINADSAPKTFTVKNVGDFPTSPISSMGVDGPFEVKNDNCTFTNVDPGQTCTVDVVFSPTSHGDLTGSIVAMATVGSSAPAALSGFGADPAKLVTTPANYDFGNVKTNTTVTKQFTVINTGDLPPGSLGYFWSNSGIYDFTNDTCTVGALGPGQSCQISFSYRPNQTGASSAQVRLYDSDQGIGSGVPADVAGTGVATDAQLAWDPPTRLFNPIPSGGSFSTPVFLVNNGEADARNLTFEPGSSSTPNVSNVHFQPGIPNGYPGPACGTNLPGGTSCGGFMIWSASSADNPTKASMKVTGLPGGTVEFVAQFGG